MIRPIEINAGGDSTRIRVLGHDLADVVTGYTLTHTAHTPPVLELTMVHGARFSGFGTVKVDARTREALLALGWTPPDGDS